jgi:Mor family transcriptional regulator
MKANCVICGKEFEKHSRGKTCSQACSRKWANEYASRYRKANLEDVREADRERMRKKRSASPETIREVNRKSYVANREKICRRASTKRASNRANLLEKMNPHVEYRPIPGFDDWRYQLGKDASLWWRKTPNSAWRKAIVKKFIGGYLSVHLTKPSGEHVHCSLGPLMLYTFRPGTRPLGYQCHYGFKGRACCELSNLEWRPQASKKVGQPAFNFKMAERGEQNHRAKLTEAKVVEARRLYVEEGWSHEDLSMHYEVSHSTIRHALSGKTWGHVPGIVLARRPGMIGVSHGMAMLTEDEVYEIRALHRSGMSGCAIARKYEVSSTTIYGIIKGRLWSHLPDPQSRPDS